MKFLQTQKHSDTTNMSSMVKSPTCIPPVREGQVMDTWPPGGLPLFLQTNIINTPAQCSWHTYFPKGYTRLWQRHMLTNCWPPCRPADSELWICMSDDSVSHGCSDIWQELQPTDTRRKRHDGDVWTSLQGGGRPRVCDVKYENQSLPALKKNPEEYKRCYTHGGLSVMCLSLCCT